MLINFSLRRALCGDYLVTIQPGNWRWFICQKGLAVITGDYITGKHKYVLPGFITLSVSTIHMDGYKKLSVMDILKTLCPSVPEDKILEEIGIYQYISDLLEVCDINMTDYLWFNVKELS